MSRQEFSLSADVPRALTPDMEMDANHSGSFLRLFGGIWLAVGLFVGVMMAVVFAAMPGPKLAGVYAGASGGAFAIAGGVLLCIGILQRQRHMAVLRTGTQVPGRVVKVFSDRMVRKNRKHPWRVQYVYQVAGTEHLGTATFWDRERPKTEAGEDITVVYLPERPGISALWTKV